MNVAEKIRAFLASPEAARRAKRDRRISLYRAGQDQLQQKLEDDADVKQIALDALLEVVEPSPEQIAAIELLTADIAAMRAAAARIRSELAGGLPS